MKIMTSKMDQGSQGTLSYTKIEMCMGNLDGTGISRQCVPKTTQIFILHLESSLTTKKTTTSNPSILFALILDVKLTENKLPKTLLSRESQKQVLS
jgi:hypothetical protein